MFPNPQDALPLPARPSIEQYRKLAKELVKACAAGTRGGAGAIAAWSDRWMAALLGGAERRSRDRAARLIEEFARQTLTRSERPCVLADAQFVLARSHGFPSWPVFVAYLDALQHTSTEAAAFERAADAIVRGDETTLQQLLREHPALIRAQSAREHRATLLHYVSANGVENYRQKSPPNAAHITELLLQAGADVEAEADVYGGGCTALGLVATSTPPRDAGVQIPVIAMLLDHGAQMEHPNLAGAGSDAVYACLANGCPEAAQYLAEHGARVGIVGAAGLGRRYDVQQLVDAAEPPRREMALRYAAGYGRREIVEFLLDRGVNVDGHHGDNQTALFFAILGDHVEIVRLLLEHGAQSGMQTRYGTVFGAALWRASHGGNPDRQKAIIERLLAAGGAPPERHPPINQTIDALLSLYGSVADAGRYWHGEEP